MATLYPFDFGYIQKEPRLGFFGRALRLSDAIDICLNVLLFFPVGLTVSHAGRRRFRTGKALLISAAVSASVLSGVIECLQLYLPFRDSALTDILSNTAGAVAGALQYQRWVGRGNRLRKSLSPALLPAMAAFTVLALSLSAALQFRTRLSNWDLTYPLLIGNEETGHRPWRGRLHSFNLTDAATPPTALRRFAAGESLRTLGTPIAAVDFYASPPYGDTVGHLPSLRWTARTVTLHTGGAVVLPGRPWLRSEGPASAVVRRLRATSAFTLRVRCATDDIHQSGPARIISNSVDGSHRNFTLGQQNEDLVFRLRTPHTGLNGVRPEFVIPGVLADNESRDVVVTYDGATLSASTRGSVHIHRMDLSPGSSVATLHHPSRPDELQEQRLTYLAALFLVPGLLIGVLGPTGTGRIALAGSGVLVFAFLLEGTLVLVSGKWFDWSSVATNCTVGALVVTLVAGTFSTILAGLPAITSASVPSSAHSPLKVQSHPRRVLD